ncbi:hypothetical protein C0389_04470 [bacterium]|nr:hypothetical protein [bacterium]
MMEDLEKRIVEHKNKVLSLWTERETNWKVIYHEEFDLKSDALERLPLQSFILFQNFAKSA